MAHSSYIRRKRLPRILNYWFRFKEYYNFEWDLNTNHPVSLVITDLNGKTIAEYKNLEGKAKQLVDFTNQTSGIYIYKVFTAQSFIKTGKIVVSK